MKRLTLPLVTNPALETAMSYGSTYRQKTLPVHPTASTEELREAFCHPLPDVGEAPEKVIEDLIAAAEPGLVGNTDPNFFAWVMGASDQTGVSADWLTSVWGQNAAIFQTAPAAAIAEEAVEDWLLELLDLPRESSVGFVTGATIAAFVGLAAARTEVLARVGFDFERDGLQTAPPIRIFLSDDAHATNFAALRYLGFGEANFERIPSDKLGLMRTDILASRVSAYSGPKIIVAQAGHINSGGFEDMLHISEIAAASNAWVHVDGAFGLWARTLQEKAHLTKGFELADSWSVDGHKWLQIPYDSGFAIVRHPAAHRRAMDVTAGYLNTSPEDGRNPTEFNPELSRRARGFSAWAVLKSLGKTGVQEIVRRHCEGAEKLAVAINNIPGLRVVNPITLNQIIIETENDELSANDNSIRKLTDCLNQDTGGFFKDAEWKNRRVLRISLISQSTDTSHACALASSIEQCWKKVAPK